MGKGFLITYRWWRDGETGVEPHHVEALEERAEERIREMWEQGYVVGWLNDHIHMTDEDPPDGVEYSGWFEIKDVEPALIKIARELLSALQSISQTCSEGIIQRNETGKPTWSALPRIGEIARAAITKATR